jgi:hypothetical protein
LAAEHVFEKFDHVVHQLFSGYDLKFVLPDWFGFRLIAESDRAIHIFGVEVFVVLLSVQRGRNHPRCNCGRSQGTGITVEGSNLGLG